MDAATFAMLSALFGPTGWPKMRILISVAASISQATAGAPDCSANTAFSMILSSSRGLIVGTTQPGRFLQDAMPEEYMYGAPLSPVKAHVPASIAPCVTASSYLISSSSGSPST